MPHKDAEARRAYMRAYYLNAENTRRRRELEARPENVEKRRRYNQSPAGRRSQRTTRQRTRARIRKYKQTPEYKAKHKAYMAAYRRRESVKARRRANDRERYRADIKFRLRVLLTSSIRQSLKANGVRKAGRPWQSMVGWTLEEMKSHLQSQFSQGMKWDNYGKWHIDHIIPVSSFSIISADCEEFHRCWSLSNLQPMWAADNIRKGSKINYVVAN